MSRKSILLPSLLSAPFHRLGEAIQDLETVGVRLLHYDVMDGHFVPNLTYGPILIKGLENHIQSQFDVHLMVTNPEVMIKWFDLPNVRSITIHIEVSHDIQRDIQDIRKRGKKVGISMNPPTPAEILDPILPEIDQILVMTVQPGLPAQTLLRDTLPKVEYYNQLREEHGYTYKIQVDGGVNEETINWVRDAGADEIVSGSAVFGDPNPPQAFQKLTSILGQECEDA